MQESGRVDVHKSEKIETYSTVSTLHFTGAIALYGNETENITGLSSNKMTIKDINIQSMQPLIWLLQFYGSDGFDDTDLDADSYLSEIELDMTEEPAFRVNNAGQYKLNLNGLEILYEDYDKTNELHLMLQNNSATSKISGTTGAVQLDIKVSPRL